jgi:hypothetical protein
LKKQEKRNVRKATPGKIKGRQTVKKNIAEEQLPLEESSSLPPTEENQTGEIY